MPPTALISPGSADASHAGSLCCFQPLDCVYRLMYGLSSKGAFAFDHALSPTTKEEGMQEAHPFMAKRKCPWITCVCSGATKQTACAWRRYQSAQKSSSVVNLWVLCVKDMCVGGRAELWSLSKFGVRACMCVCTRACDRPLNTGSYRF